MYRGLKMNFKNALLACLFFGILKAAERDDTSACPPDYYDRLHTITENGEKKYMIQLCDIPQKYANKWYTGADGISVRIDSVVGQTFATEKRKLERLYKLHTVAELFKNFQEDTDQDDEDELDESDSEEEGNAKKRKSGRYNVLKPKRCDFKTDEEFEEKNAKYIKSRERLNKNQRRSLERKKTLMKRLVDMEILKTGEAQESLTRKELHKKIKGLTIKELEKRLETL